MLVERIPSVGVTELGEAPHWDSDAHCLYYVDITGGSIHKYIPSIDKHTSARVTETGNVSFIIPLHMKKNKFIISLNRKIAIVTWDGESVKISDLKFIAEVEQEDDLKINRINDAKCDPLGRLWFGTMTPDEEGMYPPIFNASLYHMDYDKSVTAHSKVSLSNGLAWNKEGRKMYYIDSSSKTVVSYDFDVTTATINNKQVILTLANHDLDGFPDGMCIDSDDNLWVAIFNDCCVLHINPNLPDTILSKIAIPAKQVTSVAWGGMHLDELYVTTAKITVRDHVLEPPENGALYRITGLGVKGVKARNFLQKA